MRSITSFCFIVLFGYGAQGQTNQLEPRVLRPFRQIVDAISKKPLKQQCDYIVRLNKGLMSEDYAAVTRQRDLPHFGDFSQELVTQQKFELLRTLLKERELESINYYAIAELLATNHDAETFEILLINSDPKTKLPWGFEPIKHGNDIVTGEVIPDYSAFSLRHYLKNETFRAKAQTHLITVLRGHKCTGARAYAAEALESSTDPEVIKALEGALKDKGRVMTSQGPHDYVYEYVQEALQKVKGKP